MTLRRSLTVIGVLGAMVVSLLAVSPSTQQRILPGTQLGNSEVVEIGGTNAFPKHIIDPAGRIMAIHKPPERIVSAILAGDEMLSRLVEPARVRSVTHLADDAAISNVPNAYPEGIFRNHAAIEEIISMEPDLVVVAAYTNATSVEMLINAGIPIIRFAHFHSYDDVRNNLRTLAQATGAEPSADAWLRDMDARLSAVSQAVAGRHKPRVLYYSLSGSSAGPGSMMDETITLAGGHNVIADTGLESHVRIAPEMAISLQPDVILISDWGSKDGDKTAKQILLESPAWQDVPAIANQAVYSLRGAWLTSVSPFRVIGVETVARLLHPNAFNNVMEEQDL